MDRMRRTRVAVHASRIRDFESVREYDITYRQSEGANCKLFGLHQILIRRI